MIEFRIKVDYSKGITTLNKYTPYGKSWRIDNYTGEWWIKITTAENTPRFNEFLIMFLQINDAESTLKIKDCSTLNTKTIFNDERATLF